MQLLGFTVNAFAASLVFGFFQHSQAAHIRFCVENNDELTECRRFQKIPPFNADCTKDATDCVKLACQESENCVDSVVSKASDVMMVSPIALYYMNKANPEELQPIVKEKRGDDISFSLNEDPENSGLGYKVLAVVKTETCKDKTDFTITSTKGFASCHGDYGSMAGWVTPVIQLRDDGLDASDSNTDIDIIQSFYLSSCAPANNGSRLCTACSPPEANNQCDLDNDFAGSVGTLRCVREGTARAPRVGFVDHLTALGAGQNDSFVPEDGKLVEGAFQDSPATLKNLEDFRAICRSGGCRGLREASGDVDCYLESIPADVAIMRSDNPHAALVRQEFVAASNKESFRNLFGTTGNTRGALFSHGTHNLVSETADAPTYIGDSLKASLMEFDSLFSISPQTDVVPPVDTRPDQTIVMVTPRKGGDDNTNVRAAVGATLAAALLFGLLLGCGCLWFCHRHRKQKAAAYDPQAQDPYMSKGAEFGRAQTASTVPQTGNVVMDES